MLTRRQWIAGASTLAWGIPRPVRGQDSEAAEAAVESRHVARGRQAAVATVHPLATTAALETMQAGGNAADGAVAAALMLSVVDGHNSGLGGGCFILARSSNGEVHAIDGRETAPAAATPKMFFQGSGPVPEKSRTGALAVGCPGAVAAYYRLSQELGTNRWRPALRRAAEVAEEGFPLPQSYAGRLISVAEELQLFPGSRQIFLDANGAPWGAGTILRQPDLARTLRELQDGPEAFYRGRFADLLDRWMEGNGGILRKEDLRNYRTVKRQPVKSTFRGHQVIGFPPPSSGGIHVAQILGMLEHFPLEELYLEQPAQYFHVVAEAMRRAFADRAKWLGDPEFADVPRGLVDPEYLQERGSTIDPTRRTRAVTAGQPTPFDAHPFGSADRHTTHLTVADAEGNWVAITATINTTLGSKVVVPETGVVLNNEMDDFAIAPGIPNAFGLIGREANAPEGGKRPLSSMSPTIVLRDGQPVLTCGAAGGPRIISASSQLVLRSIALQQDLPAAMAAPRIHHQWRPDKLYVEERLGEGTRRGLRALGHDLESVGGIATAQAIRKTPDGHLLAASETRLAESRAGAI